MKTNAEQNGSPGHFSQSTYAMLLRANDRRRNGLEMALYACLMVSLVAVLMPLTHLIRSAESKTTEQKSIVATATSL